MTSALAVLAAAVSLLAPTATVGAEAQTTDEIELRDRLIYEQEALLNVYRSRFNIDTQIVPGGCADGEPAVGAADPQPFAGTPTDAEIAARDTLIQAQEALLNVYRCRFNIDTQIVPGGCTDGEPAEEELDSGDQSEDGAVPEIEGPDEETPDTEELEDQSPQDQYTAIAAGNHHSCAIRLDQTITCWGNNHLGQSDAPEGQYTAITAGSSFSCAIRTDQTITCWGRNEDGQLDAPQGQYTAITAGTRHLCAVRTDQTITCWGNNEHGQLDTPEDT